MQKRGMQRIPTDTHTYIKTYLYIYMYIILAYVQYLKHYSYTYMRKATDVCARVATSMFYLCVFK